MDDREAFWGVPGIPSFSMRHDDAFDRFDRWARSSSMLVVDAPSGYGKTTVLAQWLRSRGSEDAVVWISCGEWLRSREDVWHALMTGLLETGVLPPGTSTEFRSASTFAALQSIDRPVIVVYDDLDRMVELPDLELLTRLDRQVPKVRTIVVVSTDDGEVGETVGSSLVESSVLGWDERLVRRAADALEVGLSSAEVDELLQVTEGRPASIVYCLAAFATPGPRGAVGTLVREWQVRNLVRRPAGRRALVALAAIELSLRMPVGLLERVLGGPAPEALRLLLAEGLIRPDPREGGEAGYRARSASPPSEAEAVALLGTSAEAFHRAAAQYHAATDPAQQLYHLARAGARREAVSLIREAWGGVGRASPVEDFRAATSFISDADFRHDLDAVAIRVLASRVPPFDEHPRRQLESYLVSQAALRVRALPPGRRILVTAATISVLVSRMRVQEAVATAVDFLAQLPGAGRDVEAAHLDELGVLWNTVAEAFLIAGRPRDGLGYLRLAQEIGGDDSPFLVYRTTALTAFALAATGDYAASADLVKRGRRMLQSMGRAASAAAYPLVLAEALFAVARADADVMRAIASQLAELADLDTQWHAASRLATAFALFFSGRPEQSLGVLRQLLHTVSRTSSTAAVRTLGEMLRAELAVTLGHAGQALPILAPLVDSPDHSLCLHAQRSGALLAMGEPRRALDETNACVQMGSGHSLRTLPAVLLRRAVAHEQLDHGAAADAAFVDAFMILRKTSVRAPYLNLPRTALQRLFERLGLARPEFADEAARTFAGLTVSPWLLLSDRPTGLLSERERQVLALMATGRTISEIAAVLFVSANTVKTQVSSIYRKLGISSRREAADVAATMGLSAKG